MNKGSFTDNVINTGGLYGIYRGVVEDNKDPQKAGRCKIRVYGIHTDSVVQTGDDGIPTAHLPWAEAAGPIFGGSSGIGVFGVPVQGASVFLFFEAGDILQPRYFATALGIPYHGQPRNTIGDADATVGFVDPDGVYPKPERAMAPDSDTGGTPTDYTEVYVLKGHCGHMIQLDSTPSNECITIRHGFTEAFIQLDSSGNIQIHAAPSASIMDSTGQRYIITTGDHDVNISGDYLIASKDSKEQVAGNKNVLVTGARSETTLENWDMKAKGVSINSNGDALVAGSGDASFVAGNDCLVKSAERDVLVKALMGNVELNAIMGQIQGRAMTVDIQATTMATFTGLLTTVGGSTSSITSVTGQLVMIG